ncbi:MAG: ICE-like protease [Myxococcales bacterium]|nr:ICE-like protease [Myxococcales bacterium]
MIRGVAIMVALAVCTTAAAETRRVAVVIGNNAGDDTKASLRYAELDADKLARVLVELGGVAPGDLFLLQGKDLRALESTLGRAKARIAGYRGRLDHVIVIFYFSGHSDGVALELGHDRFTFAALRDWLRDAGGDVRLAVVDSCKSGALLASKGGTPGPAFHIRLADELASTGEALLTSSAADESALESREIGGSFFTHHLVSGLRGAADSSGDGRVTLTEAYQYAYKHTIATSGATLEGPQHPTYDYRLSGEGELVLTELASPSASLTVSDDFDRALVVDVVRAQVIAELGHGDPTRIAIEPGRYTVRTWRGGRTFEATIAVAANQQRIVASNELAATTLVGSSTKGDLTVEPRHVRAIEIGVAAGGQAAIAKQVALLDSLHADVRFPALHGAFLAIEASSRRDGSVRETSGFVFVGFRAGRPLGPVNAAFGVDVGGGTVVQDLGSRWTTGAFAIGALGELSLPVGRRVAVSLQAHVPATLLKADGHIALVTLPAAWLGIVIAR